MKNLKKLTSLLMVFVMVFAMSMTAFAADGTFSITINDPDAGHNYVAYQIISGEVAEDGSLLDMKWAAGQTDYETGSDAKDAFKGKTEAEIVAYVKELTLGTSADSSDECVNGQYIITGLTSGYYLVKDEAEELGKEDAYTAYILKLTNNVEADAKKAAPTVDKEVKDETADAEAGAADGWGETADHAINESFQFRLTATLEADRDYAEYETYKVVFNDTMSDGITFESIESVAVNGTPVTDYTSTATAGQAGGSWTLTIADVLAYDKDLTDGAEIVVVYNAHLNEDAAIGNLPDNKNTVYLEYSNNPNASGDNEELGETNEDTVWVFTYDMENTKVDADTGAALAGVEFELYDANDTKVGLIYDTKLEAYRPVKGEEEATAMKSAEATGKFNIVGLDAGTYTLKEVAPLPGYNACADITFTISATHSETETDAVTNIEYTGTTDANKITIENKKGTTLPETGGMGTTMFYVIGTVLVAGAAVVMITKKRMSK